MTRWLILKNIDQSHGKHFVPTASIQARSKREALNVAYDSCPKGDFDAIPWEQATEQQREAVKVAA